MGEFTSEQEPAENVPDKIEEPTTFNTDVDGVSCDNEIKQGNVSFPCFNVDKHDFFNNMKSNRRRLRFKSGSNVQQYHSQTKYQRPFYISYTDSKGKTFQRKIK
jgi:hypothetical protein